VRDPYELLGVPRDASDAEIRSAFRRLAAQHHPDRNPGDVGAQQRFADLNRAYQILSDDEKRAAWDRFGEAAFRPGGVGQGAPFANFNDLEDALRQVMGAFGLQRPPKNAVKVEVNLSLEEAVRGCAKTIAYDSTQLCSRCEGRGGEPGSATTTCGVCEGRGRVKPLMSLLPLQRERECSACHGMGTRPVRACTTCRGDGLIGTRRTLEVNFPAGVATGYRHKLKGEGNRAQPGKPAGPLIVNVTVKEHDFFKRDGDDLLCKVPISFALAALGGEIDVKTLDGHALLRVPAGVQPNTVLRMRSRGAPRAFLGGRGDQLVELSVMVPTSLSAHARRLIMDLAEELKDDKPNFVRSLRDRLRDRWR